jgi:predicted peptidase
MIKNILCLVLAVTFMTGCSSLAQRVGEANLVAQKAGMTKLELNTGKFILTTYAKISDKNAPVNVYIEGDGFAWASQGRLSVNPTPKDAFTLKLAEQDPARNVIYIARPCQYTSFEYEKSCESKYWSKSRYSEEVIDSVNKAISYYAMPFKQARINLIGYSGGAAVAVLVAERRNDIMTLRTVAGNLDHVAVNKYHGVDNLDDSLNPIDVAERISNLPQYHFAGKDDRIIPLSVTRSFAEKAETGKRCVKVSSVIGASHSSGWQEVWNKILQQPVICQSN